MHRRRANDEVRFRVNQSVAIRAPNVFDLYVGINTGLVELTPVNGDLLKNGEVARLHRMVYNGVARPLYKFYKLDFIIIS